METFPRVLFITPLAFNKVTGTGITFTNLFRGWPKDRIATVHDDRIPLGTDVCENYYRLGAGEIRKFGGAITNRPHVPAAGSSGAGSAASGILQAIKKFIFGDGLPQRGVLSPGLETWIRDFNPDIIYTILGSNGLMDIVEAVQRKFDIPMVVHIMDDWMADAFRGGLLGPVQRRRMLASIDRIIENSSLRLGICDAMCEAFSDRYGVPFQAFQNVVDTRALDHLVTDPEIVGDPVRIVYAGSVFAYAQKQSLADCAQAVAALGQGGQGGQGGRDGLAVKLDIYCPPSHIEDDRQHFTPATNVRLHGPLSDDEEFFSTICSADILLIPVNFDEKSVAYIRYSMPTRVPAYLASATPILVYGPPGVAQVDYAKETGWGHVVDRPRAEDLQQAIRRLSEDGDMRHILSTTARQLAASRHDAAQVRQQFCDALASVTTGETR